MDDVLRQGRHRRIPELEEVLELLNKTLAKSEAELVREFSAPRYPSIFIVGVARSGTTLLYQWLAQRGLFAYPSNVIARFYAAPRIGALIHKVLIDFDKHGEFFVAPQEKFTSILGKTKGASAPHEFWYFWRRFFPFGPVQKLSTAQLRKVDIVCLLKELAALEASFDKPLLMKAMILNWHIDFLYKILPKCLIVFVKRNEISTMHSLYKARLEFFGSLEPWYSFKPPEYELLKDRDIYIQLAGQVVFTNQAVQSQLDCLPDAGKCVVDYDSFCSQPEKLFLRLRDKLEALGYQIADSHMGRNRFEASAGLDAPDFDLEKAERALTLVREGFGAQASG